MIAGGSPSSWLDPVRAALDASEVACPVFFRDDDAGWDDQGLTALLDVFADLQVVVDVALIPAALSDSLAADLRTRVDHGSLRLHQHGYAHLNHEPAGRKHEFGPARAAGIQHADIAKGRRLLYEAFGAGVDPVFTPPWNRCTGETADALVAQEFEVLSRDHTAVRFDRADLPELPVTIDWFGASKGVRWARRELARRLAEGVTSGAAVGVMLHHAISDESERGSIADLARLVAGHRQARATTILQLSRELRAVSVGGSIPAAAEAHGNLERDR